MIHIINKTEHGLVFKCQKCNKIHIEFRNINLNLTENDYLQFAEYINSIDGEYWEEQNKLCLYGRKIRIPIHYSTKFCLVFNLEELKAFQELFAVPVPFLFDKDLLEKLTSNFSLN